jgi:hypothetical protein
MPGRDGRQALSREAAQRHTVLVGDVAEVREGMGARRGLWLDLSGNDVRTHERTVLISRRRWRPTPSGWWLTRSVASGCVGDLWVRYLVLPESSRRINSGVMVPSCTPRMEA